MDRPKITARNGELFYRQLGRVLDWLEDNGGGGGGGGATSFETVSKNLDAADATFTWSGGNLTSIAYVGGVIKTLNYTGDDLTSVVLSGSTPGGIDLTKTFIYSGGNLASFSYS